MGLVKVEALHVDAKGELSGAGASTLAQISKTEEGLRRLKDNSEASTFTSDSSKTNTKFIRGSDAANAERYEIKMVNVTSRQKCRTNYQRIGIGKRESGNCRTW